MNNLKKQLRFWLVITLLLGGLFLAACSSSGGTEPAANDETMEEMDHEENMDNEDMENMDHDDMEEMDHEHEDEHNRIPNENGATITITSPEDGATFNVLDQVIVEVDVKNFALGENDDHWHVYVDGVSFGMVMGGNTDQALAGLEPGEHEVSAYLSLGTHEEYEDGDSVTITVEE